MSAPRLLSLVGLGAALVAGSPVAAAAQSCTAPVPSGTCTVTTSASMTAGTVMQLTLSSTSTLLTAPSGASYDLGYAADNGPTATVKSNRPWKLQVSASTAVWSAASTEPGVAARGAKPAGDLTWSTAAGGPFTALTMAATDAALGNATGGTGVGFFYRTLYNWALDTPGSYSLTVVLTLTNQ